MTPTPTEVIVAELLSSIYGFPIDPTTVDSGLPVVARHFHTAVGQIDAMLKSQVDAATAPLYNEIIRIKAVVASAAQSVAQEA